MVHNTKKLFLSVVFGLVLFVSVVSWPTRSFADCDGCVVGAVNTASTNIVAAIIRTIAKSDEEVKNAMAGISGIQAKLTLEQKAADITRENEIAEAQASINHWRDIRKNNAETAQDAFGRVDVVCEHATQWGPLIAGDIVTRINTGAALQEALKKMGGSSEFPQYANGLVHYYKEVMTERNNAGLCDPTDDNGAMAALCTNANPKITNADLNPETISDVISSDKNNPNFVEYKTMRIDNLFPIVFTPLSKTQLTEPVANQIYEVKANQQSYKAQVSVFRRSAESDKQTTMPISGIDEATINAYKALFKELGLDGEIEKLLLSEGKLSKASMERVVYKYANISPKALSRLAGQSLSLGNLLSFSAIKQMESVAMLYDLREEQRETNRLLGAIGSIMLSNRHEEIEGKIRAAVSSGK
jgi:hypothetical protein